MSDDYVRQTGIYPECTTASVRPHLTSAVKVCQRVPAVAEGWRGSPGNTSAFRRDKRPESGAEKVQNPSKTPGFPSDAPQKWRRFTAAHRFRPKGVKDSLPLCTSAALLRPYCAPRTHLQIKRQKRWSFYLQEAFLCTLLFVHLPCEQTQESHYPNLQEKLSRPLQDAQHHAVIREHWFPHWHCWRGHMHIFDIRCFLQEHPEGENKDFDSESAESVCGNGANRLKKAQKHLAASLFQLI